LKDVKLDLL
jgi:hypothetical protein